jgi:hypothetical protein
MQQTLIDQYHLVTSSNNQHLRNRDQWEFLLESYMGGQEYARGQHLTKYVNETGGEYAARLNATHLENHCKSVISTYISFLFREEPDRDFGSIEYDPMLASFLEDADLDGRSLEAFMKEVATWSSVFGHVWIMCVKPNVGALTKGDELASDVRPYLTMITPLVVTDWRWNRLPNGRYNLTYLKYIEDVNDSVGTVKEWYADEIHTWVVDHDKKQVMEHTIEPNDLGEIPAICAYNVKSPVRGLGQSDITDISRAQRTIYNLTSEMEQSIRINGHPALVKTAGTEAAAGAGAIIQMEDNLDSGLKPYMLSVSTDISSIFTAITHITGVIDQIANTGSIRSTESRRMSGVAQQQEFELLNAKLSEKADNLELVEEQIWQWYSHYQGYQWDGKIEYPGSFNVRDTSMEIDVLVKAKSAATDPAVLRVIDEHILDMLDEEDYVLPFIDPNPQTGRTYSDGEEINANLPDAYQPADNPEVPEGQNCANCEYYKPGELYCTKFDAPVRAVYWCAKWEAMEAEEY